MPETSTTLEETSTTYPDGLLEEPVAPDQTTVPDEIVPDETYAPTTTDPQTEQTANTTQLEVENTSTTTIAEKEDIVTNEELEAVFDAIVESKIISNEVFTEILDVLSAPNIEPEQVVAIVGALLNTDLSQEQVVVLASNAEVIENVTVEQADEIFEQVVEEQISEEQGQEIVNVVQSAPKEIRESFEDKINIFSGVFDVYIPTGSTISVSERRILNAVTAILFVLPAPVVVSANGRRK